MARVDIATIDINGSTRWVERDSATGPDPTVIRVYKRHGNAKVIESERLVTNKGEDSRATFAAVTRAVVSKLLREQELDPR